MKAAPEQAPEATRAQEPVVVTAQAVELPAMAVHQVTKEAHPPAETPQMIPEISKPAMIQDRGSTSAPSKKLSPL